MGDVPSARLSDLVIALDHLRRPVRGQDRTPGPYPYYGASGIVDYVDDYIFEGLHLLIAEDGENLRTRKTPIAFLADGYFWVNNHAHVVRGNDSADTRYLSYAVEAADISGYLTGSTQPKLTKDSLLKIEVPAPALSEQRAIADVLGALDDKIESNRRQVQVLDELMVTIYRASLGGDLVPFLNIASPVSGGTPRRSEPEFWNPEIPWASAKDISAASAGVILSTFERISLSGLSNSAAELVPAGTTVITARGTVGAIARLGIAGTFNQSCYGLIPADPGVHYLEVYLSTRASVDELKRSSHGTVFDTITRQTFELLKVQKLDEGRRNRTVAEIESLDKLVIARLRESSQLMELRDTLLPELLSGRLRVRDAETVVEGAL